MIRCKWPSSSEVCQKLHHRAEQAGPTGKSSAMYEKKYKLKKMSGLTEFLMELTPQTAVLRYRAHTDSASVLACTRGTIYFV